MVPGPPILLIFEADILVPFKCSYNSFCIECLRTLHGIFILIEDDVCRCAGGRRVSLILLAEFIDKSNTLGIVVC